MTYACITMMGMAERKSYRNLVYARFVVCMASRGIWLFRVINIKLNILCALKFVWIPIISMLFIGGE